MKTERKLPFLYHFEPERWDSVTKFVNWHGPPFTIGKDLTKGLQTIGSHRSRFLILVGHISKMRPSLSKDKIELEEQGYTAAVYAKEYAAIAETLVSDLYAQLDGLKLAFYGVYKGESRVQKGSVHRFFKLAHESKYRNTIPETILSHLRTAYRTWYPSLYELRTEISHGQVGHVYLRDNKIEYSHEGLRRGGQAYIIHDIEKRLSTWYADVNSLLNSILDVWLNQLDEREVFASCGLFRGRFLARAITIPGDISADSGKCLFRHVYEEEPEFACPKRDHCAAYKRVGKGSLALAEKILGKK